MVDLRILVEKSFDEQVEDFKEGLGSLRLKLQYDQKRQWGQPEKCLGLLL